MVGPKMSMRERATPLMMMALLSLGCGVVYPEVATPLRMPPPDFKLEPPPPGDLLYIRFKGAVIPPRTRDGRKWDTVGNAAPDPYAKLIVNGKELILTPVQSDTARPTWPDQKHANYRIPSGANVKVEVWDSNALVAHPICHEEVLDIHDQVELEHAREINCDSGARVLLLVEPAHGRIGLGFYYEVGTDHGAITRVITESPAAREQIKPGERIVAVQGKPVDGMVDGQLKSLINANSAMGVTLRLREPNGRERDVTLKDGGVYPAWDEETLVE